SENSEIIRRYNIGKDATCVSFLAYPDHRYSVRRHPGENRILRANVGQGWIREGAKTFWIFFVLREDLDELMCSRVTGRRKQHRVHQTEHRGVCANAEGEHKNSSNGKAGRFQ